MEKSGYLSPILLAIIHPAAWCVLSFSAMRAAYSFLGGSHPLYVYTVIHGFFWLVLLVFAAIRLWIAFRRSRLEGMEERREDLFLFAKEIRFQVENPDEMVERILKAVEADYKNTRQVGEWVFVVEPVFPPLTGLVLQREMEEYRQHRRYRRSLTPPHHPRLSWKFEGGMAVRAKELEVRVVLFYPDAPLSFLKSASPPAASPYKVRKLKGAALRVYHIVHPESAPELSDDVLDETSVPPDLDWVWEFARSTLRFLLPEKSNPDRALTILNGFALAGYLSAFAGTVLILLAGIGFEIAMCLGPYLAIGPSYAWGAYRSAFRSRIRMHEALRGPIVNPPVPMFGAAVILRSVPFFPAAVVLSAIVLRLEWVAQDADILIPTMFFGMLAGCIFYVLPLGALGIRKGKAEADEALGLSGSSFKML